MSDTSSIFIVAQLPVIYKQKQGVMPTNLPAESAATHKRKHSSQHDQSNRKKARVRYQDARVIASQSSGIAYKDGQLNVDKFLKAHEFEIRALEDGMNRAKKSLTSRAFQDVPRDLRRRTASHNAKMVPKRLRQRALKEMSDDKTPTVNSKSRKPNSHKRLRLDTVKRLRILAADIKNAKSRKKSQKQDKDPEPKPPNVKKNALQQRPKPKAKFRKRQIHKAWLPTHLYHAKRAHMTPPSAPLWKMAIPLSPTDKSYRPMHRASTERGGIAWDTSYMSTIGLEGVQKSLEILLKALGVGQDEAVGFWEKKSSRWISGTRTWTGWLYERQSWPSKSIAPANIIWSVQDCAQQHMEESIAPASAHDSKMKRKMFIRVHPSAFMQLWEELKLLSKVQKPGVTIEDLRFEIGSIELTGPGSTEALVGALWPSELSSDHTGDGPYDLWKRLSIISNPSSLPSGALLAFDISDPRLHHPPRTVSKQTSADDHIRLMHILSSWPIDKTQGSSPLFNRGARFTASRQLPSQKAINRRKALAVPGKYPEAIEKDPKIPVLIFIEAGQSASTGSWTLMLPWKCLLPVWYSLMYYPLSTGGNIRFGGLDQKRQINFERGQPWFPGDYPGTKAGMLWEMQERLKRLREWENHPKGKRVEWSTLDLGGADKGEIGQGWACDWDFLNKKSDDDTVFKTHRVPASRTRPLSSWLPKPTEKGNRGRVITVKVTLLARGVPTTCARIYQLPKEKKLREKWLALLPSHVGKAKRQQRPDPPPKDAPAHVRRRYLAASLLDPLPALKVGDENYPSVPGRETLMGFVTTGNFNLAEGKGIGLGNIMLSMVLEQQVDKGCQPNICIVRQAGSTIGRLAKWELIP